MDPEELRQRFSLLTTAHLTDGCVRAGCPGPVRARRYTRGRARRPRGRTGLPARHVGSVDVFLEAYETANPGDVLVVDNGGRLDESCVGDLAVLEAEAAGLSGVVIWGLHRDTADIKKIGLPVFSLGSIPTGPLSVSARPADALESAVVGEWTVTREDLVFGDEDGVLFVAADRADEVLDRAEGIRDTERLQADRIRAGESLREQVRFADFLTERAKSPSLTFRQHLRSVGGAIEE